jgi:hypothetical protein
MDIDAIIDAAPAAPQAQAQPENTPETDATTEVNSEPAEPKAPEAKEDAFPKKAVNAISRRDKKIGKQAEQIRRLNEELTALRSKAPKESDFEGRPYGDLLKAEAKHAAAEESTERELKRVESEDKAAREEWKQERLEALGTNSAEARKSIPDFDTVLKQSKPFLDSLPEEISDALLEADNPAFAVVALAKEGLLGELADMSPTRAAMLIAKMEEKGLALVSKPEATKAPAPIAPVKGSGTAGKPVERMSGKELLKSIRST